MKKCGNEKCQRQDAAHLCLVETGQVAPQRVAPLLLLQELLPPVAPAPRRGRRRGATTTDRWSRKGRAAGFPPLQLHRDHVLLVLLRAPAPTAWPSSTAAAPKPIGCRCRQRLLCMLPPCRACRVNGLPRHAPRPGHHATASTTWTRRCPPRPPAWPSQPRSSPHPRCRRRRCPLLRLRHQSLPLSLPLHLPLLPGSTCLFILLIAVVTVSGRLVVLVHFDQLTIRRL